VGPAAAAGATWLLWSKKQMAWGPPLSGFWAGNHFLFNTTFFNVASDR